jgi:hypothetical protein
MLFTAATGFGFLRDDGTAVRRDTRLRFGGISSSMSYRDRKLNSVVARR